MKQSGRKIDKRMILVNGNAHLACSRFHLFEKIYEKEIPYVKQSVFPRVCLKII